jgi:hypothetical protein
VADLVVAVAELNRRRLLQLPGHGEQTVTQLVSGPGPAVRHPAGRMAVIAGPQGAVFSIIQQAPQPA